MTGAGRRSGYTQIKKRSETTIHGRIPDFLLSAQRAKISYEFFRIGFVIILFHGG